MLRKFHNWRKAWYHNVTYPHFPTNYSQIGYGQEQEILRFVSTSLRYLNIAYNISNNI